MGLYAHERRDAGQGRRLVTPALTMGGLAFCCLVLPIFYTVTLYGDRFALAFVGAEGRHLALNVLANCLVVLTATRAEGRFHERLATVLSRVLMIHGTLGFMLLIIRQFHSNHVMVLAVMASAGLGALLVATRHLLVRPRVALLGKRHPLIEALPRCEIISSPDADIRRFDVVLTPSVTDLPADLAILASRAMLMGKSVRLLAEYVEEGQGMVCIEHFDLDHLPPTGLTSYRLRKRLMDVMLVVLAAPIAAPILLIAVLMIRLTMGGPVFFVQRRTGLGGKPFRIYKLRTMKIQASNVASATIAGRDPRITPLGVWLRRSRIDELPQLWNVIKGDMSVIGPRPEWTELSDDYVKALPVYAYRHLVRPGITGWAQVRSGYASDLAETRTKVAFDLYYIKNFSFSLDVQILFRTIWTLIAGSGAR